MSTVRMIVCTSRRSSNSLVSVLVLQLHDVEDALDAALDAAIDEVLAEVRQLLEVAVLAPHGLGHHLGQLHGRDGGAQPAVAAQHIHTRLDTDTDNI